MYHSGIIARYKGRIYTLSTWPRLLNRRTALNDNILNSSFTSLYSKSVHIMLINKGT